MKRIAFVVTTALVLAGCATTQQYVPAASQETLTPGNVLVKIERKEGFLGAARSVEVSDDGKVVGELASGKSLTYQRPAGDFVLQLVPKSGMVSNPKPVDVHGIAGKQYNFSIYWSGGFHLELQ